jgi:hypothetical protein
MPGGRVRLRAGFAAPGADAPMYWAGGDGLRLLVLTGREPCIACSRGGVEAGELAVQLGDQEIGRIASANAPVLRCERAGAAGCHGLRLRTS